MPTYVARIETESGGTLLERADVTLEVIAEGEWRGRFLAPADMTIKTGATLELALADGRHGKARVHHIHRHRSSKDTPQLVELEGIGRLA
jgi:hypothetical protein